MIWWECLFMDRWSIRRKYNVDCNFFALFRFIFVISLVSISYSFYSSTSRCMRFIAFCHAYSFFECEMNGQNVIKQAKKLQNCSRHFTHTHNINSNNKNWCVRQCFPSSCVSSSIVYNGCNAKPNHAKRPPCYDYNTTTTMNKDSQMK